MRYGAILDNCPIGQMPTDSSFDKLRLMGATAVGTLWTGGTHHGRAVYERCESILDPPLYLLRVGGHRQSPAEWIEWARDALAEVPDRIILEGRIVLACGNEPSIEFGDATEYGALYKAVASTSVPVLFACPSFGMPGWSQYLVSAYETAGRPRRAIANLYAGNVGLVQQLAVRFPELYIGEVNSAPEVQGQARIDFLRGAFRALERAGVKAALVFIAGGQSNGAWDERFIISEQEAAGVAGTYEGGGTMDEATQTAMIAMEARQNAALTEMWKLFRQGKFTGADGIDGKIVELQGGQPLGFTPTYPPKL